MAKCSSCSASGVMLKVDHRGWCIDCLSKRLDFADDYMPTAKRQADELTFAAQARAKGIISSAEESAKEILAKASAEADQCLVRGRLREKEADEAISVAMTVAERNIARLLELSAADFTERARKRAEKALIAAEKAAPAAATCSLMTSATFTKHAREEFIAFDIETTGFHKTADRIVEVGAIRYRNGQRVGDFSSLVNPEMTIPKDAIAVHGITNEMVAASPKIQDILPALMVFFGNIPVVAHNASFDMGFISTALQRHKVSGKIRYYDSLAIARTRLKGLPNHKLPTVSAYLGISTAGHHRAMADCHMVGEAVCMMLNLR